MKIKSLAAAVLGFCGLSLLTGCGSKAQTETPSYEEIAPYTSEVVAVELPQEGIIALGEATHGNQDFTLMKMQVFQQLVEQSEIRAFALEGDFGGCQKVNDYINDGTGSAIEAAEAIGFTIYKTEEMVELIEWMREFNTSREGAERIRFYGFDMQRYDQNKERLQGLLSPLSPELAKRYQAALEGFTNESMYDLEEAVVKQAISDLEGLQDELTKEKAKIVATADEQTYELIDQYAKCLLENSQLRIADQYGTLRDGFMAEHFSFLYQFEERYYGSQGIFVAGHNGHIGKTTATVGTEKVAGEILSEQYGDQYYAIGTEFHSSRFLAPDDNGERQEFEVENKGDHRLAVLLSQSDQDTLYLDLTAAAADSGSKEYLNTPQAMSSIGEYFSKVSAMSEKGYTQSLVPAQTYDGLIFIEAASPSTMLE